MNESNDVSKLSGSLEYVSVEQLFQWLFTGGATGRLVAEDAERAIVICFESGRPIGAELKGVREPSECLRGEEAIYDFAGWNHGRFFFADTNAADPLADECGISHPLDRAFVHGLSRGIPLPKDFRQRVKNHFSDYKDETVARCSFCCKPDNELSILLEDYNAKICNECIGNGNKMICADEGAEPIDSCLILIVDNTMQCSFCTDAEPDHQLLKGATGAAVCKSCVVRMVGRIADIEASEQEEREQHAREHPPVARDHALESRIRTNMGRLRTIARRNCSCCEWLSNDGFPEIDLSDEEGDLLLSKFYTDCIQGASSTGMVDRGPANQAILDLYRMIGLPAPELLWFASPFQIARAPLFLNGLGEPLKSGCWSKILWTKISDQWSKRLWSRITTCLSFSGASARWDLITRLGAFHRVVSSAAARQEWRGATEILDECMQRLWMNMQSRLFFYHQAGAVDFNLDSWITRLHADYICGKHDPNWVDSYTAFSFSRLWSPESKLAFDSDVCWGTWGIRAYNAMQELSKDHLGARLTDDEKMWVDCLTNIGKSVHAFLPFKNVCFISEPPVKFATLPGGILHNASGPAVAYGDGFEVYAWNGTLMPAAAIMQPATLAAIESETNVEVRRVLMQRYGLSNYIVDSGATEICTDDAGTLYRKEVLNDEPILMVKVSDGSIRDPDGSYRTYFLRVPPDIETAQAAVAWSFSLDADEYSPSIQT